MRKSMKQWQVPALGHWTLFWIFLAANSLLAYGSPGFQTALWIALLGLVLPIGLAFLTPAPVEKQDPKPGSAAFPPSWVWIMVALAAAGIRVLQFTSLHFWPSVDDSLNAFYAMDLAENWRWHFFFGSAQVPTAFHWGLALFFKAFGPSLSALRSFPLLLSALASGLAFFAFRTALPRASALFYAMGMAVGFWPLYTGQFCMALILLLVWQTAAFLLLGILAVPRPSPHDRWLSLGLGLVTGAGFFVAIPWPLVALFLGCSVALLARRPDKKGILPHFLFPMFFFLGLFLLAGIREGYGERFRALLVLRSGVDWGYQIPETLSNLTALFWRSFSGSYGPSWGGMFNPLWTSLFFLGLLDRRRASSRPQTLWLLAGLLLFWAPGWASRDFDVFRLFQSLPLMLLAAARGFQTLQEKLPASKRTFFFAVLFLASTFLDFHHLQVQRPIGSSESAHFAHADGILQETFHRNGPGALLLDLRPNLWDKTLHIASYPFNTSLNPALPPERARWTALLVNSGYLPFLQERFPHSQWHFLGPDRILRTGDLFLGIIPEGPSERPDIAKWVEADRYFRSVSLEVLRREPFVSREGIGRLLEEGQGLCREDPFLGSCLSEKLFFARSHEDRTELLALVQEALRRGYPLPFFRQARAELLRKTSSPPEWTRP